MVQNFVNLSKLEYSWQKFIITLNFLWFNIAPPIFQRARYIGYLVTYNFVNKIFMVSRLIIVPRKFGALHLWHKISNGLYCCIVWVYKTSTRSQGLGAAKDKLWDQYFLYVQFSSKYDRLRHAQRNMCSANLIWALIGAQPCPMWTPSDLLWGWHETTWSSVHQAHKNGRLE